MKISEIETRQGNINTEECEVAQKEEPREFEKFGNKGKVCNCTIKDESGEIKLTLWNDDIDRVNVGDRVKITNGYCNEFQGEKQLTAGKFGKLEVIGEEGEKELKETEEKDKIEVEEEVSEEEKEEAEKD